MRLIGYILLLLMVPSGWDANVWLHFCGGDLEEISLIPEEKDECCGPFCMEDCCNDLLLEIESAVQDLQHNRAEIGLYEVQPVKEQAEVVSQNDRISALLSISRINEDCSPQSNSLPGAEIRVKYKSLVYYG